jgi:hypothetical protein
VRLQLSSPAALDRRGKGTTPLRLTQLFDSTPDNSTFDFFNLDTFNFRSIQLLDNSTPRFSGQFNSEQFNFVFPKCMQTSCATNKGCAHKTKKGNVSSVFAIGVCDRIHGSVAYVRMAAREWPSAGMASARITRREWPNA